MSDDTTRGEIASPTAESDGSGHEASFDACSSCGGRRRTDVGKDEQYHHRIGCSNDYAVKLAKLCAPKPTGAQKISDLGYDLSRLETMDHDSTEREVSVMCRVCWGLVDGVPAGDSVRWTDCVGCAPEGLVGRTLHEITAPIDWSEPTDSALLDWMESHCCSLTLRDEHGTETEYDRHTFSVDDSFREFVGRLTSHPDDDEYPLHPEVPQ